MENKNKSLVIHIQDGLPAIYFLVLKTISNGFILNFDGHDEIVHSKADTGHGLCWFFCKFMY